MNANVDWVDIIEKSCQNTSSREQSKSITDCTIEQNRIGFAYSRTWDLWCACKTKEAIKCLFIIFSHFVRQHSSPMRE